MALVERENAPAAESVCQDDDRKIGQANVEVPVASVVPPEHLIFGRIKAGNQETPVREILEESTPGDRPQTPIEQVIYLGRHGSGKHQLARFIDQQALQARGLSAFDVSAAVSAQNLILPAGTAKIGRREYGVRLNSSPSVIDDLADLPIKTVNGATIRIGDVATVRDGYAVQTNVVRQDGRRSALLTVLKSGGASTLSVVERVKQRLPQVLATLPGSLRQFTDHVVPVLQARGLHRTEYTATTLRGHLLS